MNLKLFIFCIYLIKLLSCSNIVWNYDTLGPDYWKVPYPKCDGQRQSPINIITKDVVYDSKLKDISFNDYNTLISWNLTNTADTDDNTDGYTGRFYIYY